MSVLQPRLFDDLPPTREETPVHQLNYPTFASAESTMWHGRTRWGPLWDDRHAKKIGWNPERNDPVHVGSFEAAAHRGLGEMAAKERRPGPGDPYQIRFDGVEGGNGVLPERAYRPREDLSETASMTRGKSSSQSQMLPFRIREERMFNTPDMPVSDAYANLAAGNEDDHYLTDYYSELESAGLIEHDPFDPYDDGFRVWPEPIEESGGVYYRNEHEDKGAVSAVVPSAKDLQHWPTEVMNHSTNPAQRRTAEFLLGRGH